MEQPEDAFKGINRRFENQKVFINEINPNETVKSQLNSLSCGQFCLGIRQKLEKQNYTQPQIYTELITFLSIDESKLTDVLR